jgi:hypothetical protein
MHMNSGKSFAANKIMAVVLALAILPITLMGAAPVVAEALEGGEEVAPLATTWTPTDWASVQTEINDSASGDTIDLSGLGSPGSS